MATKGFRVDTDRLSAVADQVQNLLDDLSGSSNIQGDLPNYTKYAQSDQLAEALKAFFDSPAKDAYANAYQAEYNGIIATMNAMKQQLTNLQSACRSTAQQYDKHDKDSKTVVNKSDPGGSTPTNWGAN